MINHFVHTPINNLLYRSIERSEDITYNKDLTDLTAMNKTEGGAGYAEMESVVDYCTEFHTF
jgi:hypothetical protein